MDRVNIVAKVRNERYFTRLRAFPAFLAEQEAEGRGWFSLNGTGISYLINFGTSFSEYCQRLEVDLWSVLEEYVASSETPVKVVDVGCGRGDALKEVKLRYGDRVRVIGFELARLSSHEELDELVIGNFEAGELPESLVGSIHLAVSDKVFRYFLDPFGRVYEKVWQMLKPGGKAFLDVHACDLPENWSSYDIAANHRLTVTKPRS